MTQLYRAVQIFIYSHIDSEADLHSAQSAVAQQQSHAFGRHISTQTSCWQAQIQVLEAFSEVTLHLG